MLQVRLGFKQFFDLSHLIKKNLDPVNLSVYISINLSVILSANISNNLSVNISIYLYINQTSINQSVFKSIVINLFIYL